MKKYLLTLVALMCLGFTMNAQVNLQDGLIGYWPFNGNANDESGNGNNGTVNGATLTTDRFGNENSAYSFDGVSNYIVMEQNIFDFLNNPKNEFSLNIHFFTSYVHEEWQTTLWDKHLGWGTGIELRVYRDTITLMIEGPTYQISHTSCAFNINEWIMLTVTSQNEVVKLFRNAQLIDELDLSQHSFNTPLNYMLLGKCDQDYYYNGKIDDIRIYNRALNEQEIQALYIEGTGATISTSNQTATIGRSIEISVNTSELGTEDNVIAYQIDFNYDNTKLEYLSNTLTGTLAADGSLQVNPTTGKLAIAWARETPMVGEGAIIKLQFKVIDAGETTPTITNALYNTEAVNATNGTITATYKYGDIDANDHVQAYDAALAIQYSVGLDPIPAIDPLPWENWRIVTANVDGVGGVTANDASEILKYTVGLITIFPVEDTKKSGSASNADINVSVENSEIVLTSTGELFGLNVFVNENFSALGQPENFVENALFVKNISETNYAFGFATAYSPENNVNIVKIPYSTSQNQSVTFDMIINTEVKSVTVGLTTGIVTINEQSVLLYPNPANSVLYLSGVVNVNVSIFDISGRIVFNQLNVNNQIDISTLPKGLYTVKIENGNESITRKLIKN